MKKDVLGSVWVRSNVLRLPRRVGWFVALSLFSLAWLGKPASAQVYYNSQTQPQPRSNYSVVQYRGYRSLTANGYSGANGYSVSAPGSDGTEVQLDFAAYVADIKNGLMGYLGQFLPVFAILMTAYAGIQIVPKLLNAFLKH